MKYLMAIALAYFAVGCAHHKINYNASLQDVSIEGKSLKPFQAKGDLVASTGETSTTKPATTLFYDTEVSISSKLNPKSMMIAVHNLSKKNVKINWNESYLIDHGGATHKVFHNGVRYIARNEYQPPTIILPGKTHIDVAISVNTIEFNQYGGWINSGLLPERSNRKKEELENVLKNSYVGKNIFLNLNVVVEGTARDYLIKHSIDNAYIPKKTRRTASR